MITVAAHPLLDLGALTIELPQPLASIPTPDSIRTLFTGDATPGFERGEEVRALVRDLLRAGGYKPTGRGKPSSEYLARAVSEGAVPSINVVVDACNAWSFLSGLPVSVVDRDLLGEPLRVDLAAEGSRYVFNASGQEIDASYLLGLHDAAGPCANAVKDAQRTKTGPTTRRALALIWGHRELSDRTSRVTRAIRSSLESAGAVCAELQLAVERADTR